MKNIKKVLREALISEYYDYKISNDIKKQSNRYIGRGVTWYGIPGQMAVLHESQVRGMWGNVYDQKKMDFLANMIGDMDNEIVELECSYGIAECVDLNDIEEHQMAVRDDSFATDFDGHTKPYTTGDVEMDIYLVSEYPLELDMFDMYGDSDLSDFIEENRTTIATNYHTEEYIRSKFHERYDSADEGDLECLENFIKMEHALAHAIKTNSGDLGRLSVQLRDGHHRVFGAIQAGEEYVCVNITKESIAEFGNLINLVETS